MTRLIEAIRGMNDILPEQIHYWHYVEAAVREMTAVYGYSEIRFPILEKTALFKRSIGNVTDIVEKEMYSFEDRNGDNVSLRPEGTAGCVRAAIQNGLLYNQTRRLWYMGPMFRHERPQKGRYRQFNQLGIEAFGFDGPDIDAEIILLAARLWEKLGIDHHMTLELNTLGTPESREAYKKALIQYFEQHTNLLDEDSKRRLSSNPLRILDSKNPDMQTIIHHAPVLFDYLDESSRQHFEKLKQILTVAGIEYKINPHLVRGLDYYTQTVFEWVTDRLGAQSTVCAGGRFNGLVEQLGGKATPAVGFGLGIERLILLMQAYSTHTFEEPKPHAYLILVGEHAQIHGLAIAEQLRKSLPTLRLTLNCGGGSFKNQFKKADKSGARYAWVLGDDEMRANQITLKYLRESRDQEMLTMEQLIKQMESL